MEIQTCQVCTRWRQVHIYTMNSTITSYLKAIIHTHLPSRKHPSLCVRMIFPPLVMSVKITGEVPGKTVEVKGG